MPAVTMPINAVLKFLYEHHPALHARAEIERAWVWLADTDLQGPLHAATRVSLGSIGFKFKFNGSHALPSGRTARWSHHCEKPLPYRKGKWRGEAPAPGQKPREMSDDEILAAL